MIASQNGAFFGGLLYSKWLDLEPKLHEVDIDIKDIQKVFGRDGSTCQAPISAPPPLDPPVPSGSSTTALSPSRRLHFRDASIKGPAAGEDTSLGRGCAPHRDPRAGSRPERRSTEDRR